MLSSKRGPRSSPIAPSLVALGVFVLLAVVHTWPLARDPAHLSRNDNGDTLLNTWAIAWVAHQLPRDPVHLFDANMFYPERRSLAYTEAMIVQGVLAMPVLAAGGSPVLAYNLVLLAGFTLTGWAFCLLIQRWTGSWVGGYVGGSAAAFNSHVLVRLPHLQAQHVEFVALMMLALDRLVGAPRIRYAVWLGVSFALQGLTCMYLFAFSTWALVFAIAARAGEWARRAPAKMLGLLLIAVGTTALLTAPYLLAYYQLHRLTGYERTVADAQRFAVSWVDFLSTGSRLHYTLWSHRFFDQAASPSFPGFVAIVLAGLAITWPETRRDVRLRMCLVVMVGCVAVAVLPATPVYPSLHRLIPLFWVVRAPARITQIVLLMIAVAAGFGAAGLSRRWPSTRLEPAFAVALCALVNLEALRAPLVYQPFSGIPPMYDILAGQSPSVVVELPLPDTRSFFLNGPYLLNSTRHWRPMLNGYGGFAPASYARASKAVSGFPDDRSLIALHERGVTHVVVHENDLGRDRFQAIARIASLQLMAEHDDIHIYRLR